jgi:hypothetical protein
MLKAEDRRRGCVGRGKHAAASAGKTVRFRTAVRYAIDGYKCKGNESTLKLLHETFK